MNPVHARRIGAFVAVTLLARNATAGEWATVIAEEAVLVEGWPFKTKAHENVIVGMKETIDRRVDVRRVLGETAPGQQVILVLEQAGSVHVVVGQRHVRQQR